jgi:ribonucleoside-diphosphate reductase beta chain
VGIKIVNTLRKEYPELFDEELETRIVEECKVALESEGKIIEWIVGTYDHEGMNADILKTFIAKRMKDSLKSIGIKNDVEFDKKLIKQTKWMDEELLGNNMTDFFAKKPIDYARKDKTYNVEDLGFDD